MTVCRRYGMNEELESGYREMARNEAREAEAIEWAERLVGDVANEPRDEPH